MEKRVNHCFKCENATKKETDPECTGCNITGPDPFPKFVPKVKK
jgi:hypothetical protein